MRRRPRRRVATRESWDSAARGLIADRVREALIGESRPHDAQRDVLERLDRGLNTLAVFGTGRGKSFCFQFPPRCVRYRQRKDVGYLPAARARQRSVRSVDAAARSAGSAHLSRERLDPSDEREDLFEALREGAWDLVLATPEFLEFHRSAFSGASAPAFVVVDEAHHLYDSTHRPAYASSGRRSHRSENRKCWLSPRQPATKHSRRRRRAAHRGDGRSTPRFVKT